MWCFLTCVTSAASSFPEPNRVVFIFTPTNFYVFVFATKTKVTRLWMMPADYKSALQRRGEGGVVMVDLLAPCANSNFLMLEHFWRATMKATVTALMQSAVLCVSVGVCAYMCAKAKNSRNTIPVCPKPSLNEHCFTVCLSMSVKFTHLPVKIFTTLTATPDSSPLANWHLYYGITAQFRACQL